MNVHLMVVGWTITSKTIDGILEKGDNTTGCFLISRKEKIDVSNKTVTML